MIDDAKMAAIMDAATSDDPDAGEVIQRVWDDLSDTDRFYAMGYVAGYVEGVRHTQLAMGYNGENNYSE